jgi:hypothetical protein
MKNQCLLSNQLWNDIIIEHNEMNFQKNEMLLGCVVMSHCLIAAFILLKNISALRGPALLCRINLQCMNLEYHAFYHIRPCQGVMGKRV